MHWAILAVLLIMEASALLLVVQILARCFWMWIRWPVWILLVGASLFAADAAITKFSGQGAIAGRDWRAAEDLLRLDSPYPTFRYFVLSLVCLPPVLLFLLGLFSLLRWKRNGLKVVFWPISFQSSLTALAICFGLLLVLVFENDNAVWRKVQEMEQKSRALALTVAPEPSIDDQNAAPLFVELGGSEAIGQRKLPDPTDDIERLRSYAWAEYFSVNRDRAEQIRQAATKPHCRFDIDWSDADSSVRSPDVERARACVQLLYWEGRRALLEGEAGKGLANAVALRRIAEFLSQDPRCLAQLEAAATEHLAGNVIEHLLYVQTPKKDDIAPLIQKGFEFRRQLPAFVTFQQANHYRRFAKLYSGQALGAGYDQFRSLPLVSHWVHAQGRLLYATDDYRALPGFFSELDHRCALPYSEAGLGEHDSLLSAGKLGGARIAQSVDASIPLVETSVARADMKRRLVNFALIIAEKGLVERVQSLGPDEAIPPPERPIDLFVNQPVKLTVADGGVVLHSVGPEEQDDRGSQRAPPRSRVDMTFCFGQAFRARRLVRQANDPDRQPLERRVHPAAMTTAAGW